MKKITRKKYFRKTNKSTINYSPYYHLWPPTTTIADLRSCLETEERNKPRRILWKVSASLKWKWKSTNSICNGALVVWVLIRFYLASKQPQSVNSVAVVKFNGGSVAEWSARQTRNLAVPGSSPALATCWICSRSSRVQILDHAYK